MEAMIQPAGLAEMKKLCGLEDQNIKLVGRRSGARIEIRDGSLRLNGERHEVESARRGLLLLLERIRNDGDVDLVDVQAVMDERGSGLSSGHGSGERRDLFRRDVRVRPKSDGQKNYLEMIEQNEIVFCIGPAGTGKTFLAVYKAVEALKQGLVRRIVLVRPAVEAGEKLGFLPGDIEAKVNPYLRPIYDAINHFLEVGRLKRLIENDIVEIVPLAFMRGRSLEESCIIMDEAQNTTKDQMKMFLTRMGKGSRIVATGDVTQVDLPPGRQSGLRDAESLLKGVEGIGFAYLSKEDIIRHPLVQRIVDAYEKRR